MPEANKRGRAVGLVGRVAAEAAASVRQAGFEPVEVTRVEPGARDVLAWVMSPDDRAKETIQALAAQMAGCVRPWVLAMREPFSVELTPLLDAGLCHAWALGPDGFAFPELVRQHLSAWAGERYRGTGGRLIHQIHRVTSSADHATTVSAIGALVARQRAAADDVNSLRTITDELISNALYNAPSSNGRSRFAHLSRDVGVKLDEGEVIAVTIELDEQTAVIGVVDPFGSLTSRHLGDSLLRSLGSSRLAERGDKAGAGLGLAWIFKLASHVQATVQPGTLTRLTVCYSLTQSRRERAHQPCSFDFTISGDGEAHALAPALTGT